MKKLFIIMFLLLVTIGFSGIAMSVSFDTFGVIKNVDTYGTAIVITFEPDANVSGQFCSSNGLVWRVTKNRANFDSLSLAANASIGRLTRISQNTGAGPADCEANQPVAQIIKVSKHTQ